MSVNKRHIFDRVQNFLYDFFLRIFPLAVMGGLALLSYWLLKLNTVQEATPVARVKRHVPDYVFSNIKISTLGDDGETKYRLIAKSLSHYEDDASIDLDEPKLRSFIKNSSATTVSSKKGHLDGDLSVLELIGKAEMSRPAELGRAGGVLNPALKVSSNYFRVLINDDIVTTNQAVRIERGVSIMTASAGAQFENVPQKITLLGNVKGFLAPIEMNQR